jgi:glycosyltransferase involved in cell wall biosynthesis
MKDQEKRKVCFLSYRNIPCTVVENFSSAVASAGYDVTVITIRNNREPEFEIVNGRKFYRISLLENYPVKSRRNGFKFIFKAIEILIEKRFHIIQITSTCPYFIFLRLFTIGHARAIFHILSYPIATSFTRSIRKMIITTLQSYFMDNIVFQSEELRENWIGLRKFRKAIVIPVGFNSQHFYPSEKRQKSQLRAEFGIRDNESLLVYCGVIAHQRNIDQLIEAYKIVVTDDNQVRLLVVGDGPALFDIKALSRRLALEDRIIFTGIVPYTEVRQLIAMADIGLSYIPINNNYDYNPPLKTFEYLACALPTIATKTKSNSKIIQNGYNGILVADTPKHVAKAIRDLLDDKKLQKFLSENSRKSISKFDFYSITQKSFLPLYNGLLKSNGAIYQEMHT